MGLGTGHALSMRGPGYDQTSYPSSVAALH